MHANISTYYDNYLIDEEASIRHSTQSVQLYWQIGDIEGLMFALGNFYYASLEHGRLNDIEELIAEYLEGLTVPEARLKSFIEDINPDLSFYRGEWLSALKIYLSRIEELRSGKKI